MTRAEKILEQVSLFEIDPITTYALGTAVSTAVTGALKKRKDKTNALKRVGSFNKIQQAKQQTVLHKARAKYGHQDVQDPQKRQVVKQQNKVALQTHKQGIKTMTHNALQQHDKKFATTFTGAPK